MYVEGIVSEVNETGTKAKIKVLEWEDFVTEWLQIPQMWSVRNKSKCTVELNTLVSAVLSEDMTRGAILGAIYNDEDILPEDMKDSVFSARFEDGSEFKKNTDEEGFTVIKNLKVIGDIVATGDITDKKSSMQDMRDIYNPHAHTNGNEGANTGSAIGKM